MAAWLPWLDREFGWDERTALNFMRVHQLVGKNEKFSDLSLPVSGLYLLAAPSTPEVGLLPGIQKMRPAQVFALTPIDAPRPMLAAGKTAIACALPMMLPAIIVAPMPRPKRLPMLYLRLTT
jgi:hypothetical protein